MPSDGAGLGWTRNISWPWRGTDASELLCDTPNYINDYWGNSFHDTVIIAQRGSCPNAVKAQNAILLGAVGLIVLSAPTGDPDIMLGPEIVTIPVRTTIIIIIITLLSLSSCSSIYL
jgi:hypothetical protein